MGIKNKHNKKGFVLIQGGGMGAWIWENIIPLLNYPCLALDKRFDEKNTELNLNQITVADCARYVKNEIMKMEFSQVIIVGHSIGGLISLKVASGIRESVRHIVLIAGSVPREGKRAIDILPFFPRLLNRIALLFQSLGITMPKKQVERTIRKNFCNASEESVIKFVLSHAIKREPKALAFERIFYKGILDLDISFIKLLKDRTISIKNQDKLIENLGGAYIYTINADHMVMLSKPEELAKILNRIAEEAFK